MTIGEYGTFTAPNPRPGDLILSRMPDAAGILVLLGEKLIADDSGFGHVDVVVNALGDPHFPHGRVVRAMPRGAEFADLAPRLAPTHAVCTIPLSIEQRGMVPAVAATFTTPRGGRGIPYSFRSYLALALIHWGFNPQWLLAWIARTGELMCSQLADELLRRVGFQLFDDGGWRGDVSPGDIDHRTDTRYIQPPPMVRRVTRRSRRQDMSQPTATPTISDLGASLLRTFVAAVVGGAIAYLARRLHIVLDGPTAGGVVQAFTVAVIGVYYTVARVLETKWKGFGFLLGLVRQPKYVTPAS
jgi:hypothetical protein